MQGCHFKQSQFQINWQITSVKTLTPAGHYWQVHTTRRSCWHKNTSGVFTQSRSYIQVEFINGLSEAVLWILCVHSNMSAWYKIQRIVGKVSEISDVRAHPFLSSDRYALWRAACRKKPGSKSKWRTDEPLLAVLELGVQTVWWRGHIHCETWC